MRSTEDWKLLEKTVHIGYKGNISFIEHMLESKNTINRSILLAWGSINIITEIIKDELAMKLIRFLPQPICFFAIGQNSPGILQPSCKHMQTESRKHMTDNKTLFRMNHSSKIVTLLVCLTIKSFLTNKSIEPHKSTKPLPLSFFHCTSFLYLLALRDAKSSSSVGRYSWLIPFIWKNNKTTSALHKRINTFTASFPSASYVKQQTFKSLCVQKLPVLQDVNRIHTGSADGYIRSCMKSILSHIKLPTHVRGVQAWQSHIIHRQASSPLRPVLWESLSLLLSVWFFLCLSPFTRTHNTKKYGHT